ncbi:hypothetical protein EVJ58_g7738 [Rhodofomes roseus]|uniref:Uncharacterized protein n=1 Tax=Rhodofomes roseus TaxID=34475 RepID=A0A4Y9Y2Y1_9APHY|nr:hypothetical protein EVJ58_g7738 [Rhodofomes roseus]
MVSVQERLLLERLAKVRRKRSGTIKRKNPNKKPRASRKLLAAEKQELKRVRAERRRTLDDALTAAQEAMWEHAEAMAQQFEKHDPEHYFRLILQKPAKQLDSRRINLWNAFVHSELKTMNDDVPAGTDKFTPPDTSKDLRKRWNAMTMEEKREVTKEAVEELEEMREQKRFGEHSANVSAFHDARRTIPSLEHECDKLRDRTKIQTFFVAFPSEPDAWLKPYVYWSHQGIPDFMQAVFKMSPETFAIRGAAYLTSGVTGVIQNHAQRTLSAKANLTALVKRLLNEASPNPIPQIKYNNFAHNMTKTHGMVVKNYPPGVKFCAPSNLSSLAEVELVTTAWESGTTYWYHLKEDEYQKWEKEYNAALLADAYAENGEETDKALATSRDDAASPARNAAGSSTSTTDYAASAAAASASAASEPAAVSEPAAAAAVSEPAAAATSDPVAIITRSSVAAVTPSSPTAVIVTTPSDLAAPAGGGLTTSSTVSSKGTKRGSATGGSKAKAKKQKKSDGFINHGCVADENGRPVALETTTRKPRKKETKPRKRTKKQAQSLPAAETPQGGSLPGDPSTSVSTGSA